MLRLQSFMHGLIRRNPHQPEFHQAVNEFAQSVIPYINCHPKYLQAKILERMTEPDRIIQFRVCWQDDRGNVRVNRGYRVQFNNSIGPYKGGLRFDKNVNLSVLKFLAFEQTLKNSLTTLSLGSGKGGADFNPKGKSDGEIMRFCQSFMTELFHNIGSHVDIPAGDIGVGAREISFLYGQYKRLTKEFSGVMTGKGLTYGGSLIRRESTGFGCVYFAREMLTYINDDITGKVCVLSGSGNVAQHCAMKLLDLDAKVMTLSDRGGYLYFPDGLTCELLEEIIELKTVKHGRLSDLKMRTDLSYFAGENPWAVPCDIAFPAATQNELDAPSAKRLIRNGCRMVCEAANMPSTKEAIDIFMDAGILFSPGKASNAGGVAVSGLEMAQNSMRLSWTKEEVDFKLQNIMHSVHEQCLEYGMEEKNRINYIKGANIAGFIKVADSMLAFGVV